MTGMSEESPSPENQGRRSGSFVKDLKAFALSHKIEVAAALFAGLGVCIFLFNPYLGGAIVGLVAGLFLAEDIKAIFFKFIDIFKRQYHFKTLLVGSIGMCVLLSLPTLLLGALAGIGVKSLIRKD